MPRCSLVLVAASERGDFFEMKPPSDIQAEIEREFGGDGDATRTESADPHHYLLWDSDRLLNYSAADVDGLTKEQRIAFHRYRAEALIPAIEILDKEPQYSADEINRRLEIVWMLEAILEDEIERRTRGQVPDELPDTPPRKCTTCTNDASTNLATCANCWLNQKISNGANDPTLRGKLRRMAYGP